MAIQKWGTKETMHEELHRSFSIWDYGIQGAVGLDKEISFSRADGIVEDQSSRLIRHHVPMAYPSCT